MDYLEFKKMILKCLTEDEDISKLIVNILLEQMSNIDLKIKKTNDRAEIPIYGSEGAAAFDLRCLLNADEMEIKPGETIPLNTGLAMAIPKGMVGLVFARSGLGCKKGLVPSNCVGR